LREPFHPREILKKFSNRCLDLVREKVEITYENWKEVPKALKEYVWKEMLKWFTYLDGFDEDKCKQHVMVLTRKSLHNFRYKLNKDYVQNREVTLLEVQLCHA
jgi:hypothetical protein